MHERKDIILVADYHACNTEIRWFNCATAEERRLNIPTTNLNLLGIVERAQRELLPTGGQIVWIMESTTGWARVKDLLGDKVQFLLANVLRVPREPKAYRRKSDKLDTARLLREYLHGSLPLSYQPAAWWRQVRRLVDARQDLVERQTAVKNWITHFLHHETWQEPRDWWTKTGQRHLRRLDLPAHDRLVLDLKLQDLEQLAQLQRHAENALQAVYDQWPAAQRLDAIRGIGMITAVSLLARIGPIERFAKAEALIAYAGLSPARWQSDGTVHTGRIGGAGTDGHLRYLLIESMHWVCQIPRYRLAFERARARRGTNVARIIISRMLLRSLFKMLRGGVVFNPVPAA